MGSAAETRILEILQGLGLLTAQQRETVEYLFAERVETPDQMDRLVGAYLVNKEAITVEDLELAEICQRDLRDPSLLVQTRTHVKMAKYAAVQIRRRIKDNRVLSEAILKTGEKIKGKSSSSDFVAVGFLAARKLDDGKSSR